MAYAPRYYIIEDGCTFHVTWQCHNFDWFLETDSAKEIYYNLLLKYKDRYGVKIHSYSFMSNHPHLTGTMESSKSFSDFFRIVNSLFARAINKSHKRRGQVVMDRFKSPRIEGDDHHLEVMMYGDLNQVRAKMVEHPRKYKWTSYFYYAYGRKDLLITPAPAYDRLGRTAKARQTEYRKMLNEILKKEGPIKKKYSVMPFIGNPDWVIKKHRELNEKMKLKRQSFILRQRKHLTQFY